MKLQKVSNQDIKGFSELSEGFNKVSRYSQVSKNSQIKDSVSFSGKVPPMDPNSSEEVAKELSKIMPRSINGMKKLKDKINEFLNIVINSMGTGLIAPLFIIWNPMSHTDKDTRTYTAWRQPVSAVLAIATQAVCTLPFTSAIKRMAKEGAFGQLYNETPYSNPVKFIRDLRTKNTIMYDVSKFNGNSKLEKIKPETYDKLITHKFDDLIKQEKDELYRYTHEKRDGRIKRSIYYTDHSDAVIKVLSNIDEKLADIKKAKDAKNYLNDEIRRLQKSKTDDEIIELVSELRDRALYNPKTKRSIWDKIFFRHPKLEIIKDADNEILKGIRDKIGRVIGTDEVEDKNLHIRRKNGIIYRYIGKTEKQATKLATDSLKEQTQQIVDAKNFLVNLKKKYNSSHLTISQIEKEFREKMNGNFRLGEKQFAYDILSELKSYTKNNINIFKQVEGMTVSFAMLPITCALLNWVYPRFMDAVFPNLSSKKHARVSSELVQKATKNSEVK